MKLCKCGCGDKVKHPSSTYLRGHSNRDPKVKEKKRLTSLKNYGVENPNQSKLIKQKKKTTNLKNLGVEINTEETIKKAFNKGHDKGLLTNIYWQFKSLFGYNIKPEYKINEEKLEKLMGIN